MSKELISKSHKPIKWRVNSSFKSLFEGQDPINWQDIESNPEVQVIQDKLYRKVLYIPESGDRKGMFIKIFRPFRLRQLLELFSPFYPAKKEFYMAKLLNYFGINSPTPVAYAQLFNNFRPVGSIYVCSELKDASGLGELMSEDISEETRSEIYAEIGQFLARIHQHGVFPRDLHLDNILTYVDQKNIRKHYLIDHEETRWFAGYFKHWRNRNLVSILYPQDNLYLGDDAARELVTGYLTQLHGLPPSDDQVNQTIETIKSKHQKVVSRRTRKSTNKPYKSLVAPGKYRIKYRRGVDPAPFLEHCQEFESQLNNISKSAAVFVNNKKYKVRTVAHSIFNTNRYGRPSKDVLCRIDNMSNSFFHEYFEPNPEA